MVINICINVLSVASFNLITPIVTSLHDQSTIGHSIMQLVFTEHMWLTEGKTWSINITMRAWGLLLTNWVIKTN